MEAKMNEFQAEMHSEFDAENELAGEMTPAEHWSEIMAHMENMNAALRDLKEALEGFNKSAV